MNLQSNSFWSDLMKKVFVADGIKTKDVHVQHELQKLLQTKFPMSTVRVYPFGSRIMGVAQEGSDLDVYVDVGNTFRNYTRLPTSADLQRQRLIADAIISHPDFNYLVSHGGGCPIVKTVHKPTSLHCDISFSSGLTYNQNKLVMYIFDLQPIARYMVIYLRGWIKDIQLNEEFRSHIIILLVIFFLQQQNFLPGIDKLQEGLPATVGQWVTTFREIELSQFRIDKINVNMEETRKILKEFF